MTFRPPSPEAMDELLERFIDGTLNGEELAFVEDRIEKDPAIRDQLELQSRIDDSLRRMCTIEKIPMPAIPADIPSVIHNDVPMEPPAPIPFRDPHATVSEPKQGLQRSSAWTGTPWKRWGILAMAAALLLTFAGLYRGYWDAKVPDFRLMEPVAMYDRLVRTGFTPAVICKTEPEFARLVREKLGSALVATATPGIEVLGWGYQDDYDGSPISPRTMMLLTRVEGTNVLVLMDETSRDRDLEVPEGSAMRIFRREIGPLVTYEVTPLDQPRVLQTLRQIE
jgi:hypothetical protein